MRRLRPALMLPLLWAVSAPVAFAQDDDLDDLPDDLLDGAGASVKVKSAPTGDDPEPDFDFGDDPDWDAPPAPVPVPGGLDEEPPDDLPAGDDEFFEDDPPDDFAPAAADPLDGDPPMGGGGAASAGAAATGIGLATLGKAPLGDHFPAAIVARDIDAVVIELPVLVAAKPADFDADYWLITEVMVEDRKVAESRHFITRASVADMGATVVWAKSHVPVADREGTVQLKVSQKTGNGTAKSLFTKEVPYAL